MELIINILGFASFGALLQNFDLWQWMLDRLKLQVKPFNCTLCWTFWITLGAYLGLDHSFIGSIALAALTGVLAELIDRKLNQF